MIDFTGNLPARLKREKAAQRKTKGRAGWTSHLAVLGVRDFRALHTQSREAVTKALG